MVLEVFSVARALIIWSRMSKWLYLAVVSEAE